MYLDPDTIVCVPCLYNKKKTQNQIQSVISVML